MDPFYVLLCVISFIAILVVILLVIMLLWQNFQYTVGYSPERDKDEDEDEVDAINVNRDNISPRFPIEEYARFHWPADTRNGRKYRDAYNRAGVVLRCNHIRNIRGDNYCGIRAPIVQVLFNGIKLRDKFSTAGKVKELVNFYMNEPQWELNRWSFANQLVFNDVKEELFKCIDEFYKTYNIALRKGNVRENWVVNRLNRRPLVDTQIMETTKLLMMLDCVDFYRNRNNRNNPIFVDLIFTRRLSQTPADMLTNLLNTVGDTGGIEQLDMCLLGHALGVCIVTARLSKLQDEFITQFPQRYRANIPNVYIVSEEDKHYNILLP